MFKLNNIIKYSRTISNVKNLTAVKIDSPQKYVKKIIKVVDKNVSKING